MVNVKFKNIRTGNNLCMPDFELSKNKNVNCNTHRIDIYDSFMYLDQPHQECILIFEKLCLSFFSFKLNSLSMQKQSLRGVTSHFEITVTFCNT